jgi:hypothetical protein
MIPVYMISAYENEEYKNCSELYGANGFIPKPLDFEATNERPWLRMSMLRGAKFHNNRGPLEMDPQ